MTATGMDRLQFMDGDWAIEAFTPTEDGEWTRSALPKETRIDSYFDGRFLQEHDVQMLSGEQVIRFFIMWSYDQYRETYRMAACDNHDGLMDILEGGFLEGTDTISVDNLQTGTAMQDEAGNTINLRLVSTKNSQDQFTDEMQESGDGGGTWTAIYRAIHTRKP